MRTTNKAFLSSAFVAAGLLAGTAVMAAEANVDTTCTTLGGWTINVSKGPCLTTQTNQTTSLTCDPAGTNTGIEYEVLAPGGGTATPDHTFTLVHVTRNGEILFAGGGSEGVPYPRCVGDNLSGLGLYACHEQAVRLNPESNKANGFKVIVKGKRESIATSVVVKKGKATESCLIQGLGLEVAVDPTLACVESCGNFNPLQTVKKVETYKFKVCEATFEFDLATGAVTNFSVTGPGCTQDEGDVNLLEVTGPGIDPGSTMVSFGDGWVSSGTGSCNTRLIAGRYYTVCD